MLGIASAVMTLASPVGLGLTALFAEGVGLIRWFALAGGVTVLCGVLCLVLPAVRRCDLPQKREAPAGRYPERGTLLCLSGSQGRFTPVGQTGGGPAGCHRFVT
ncbi:MAG: hypothetical protein ACLSAF_08665 [Intestinimonas sp.]